MMHMTYACPRDTTHKNAVKDEVNKNHPKTLRTSTILFYCTSMMISIPTHIDGIIRVLITTASGLQS